MKAVRLAAYLSLGLAALGLALRGATDTDPDKATYKATYRVGYLKASTIFIPQATAAYAVDPAIAEASADRGVVTVTGKRPGSTHVVVITPDGVQNITVVIPVPPPIYPKGWVAPPPENLSGEAGYFESRYTSLPQQLTNVLDFSRQAEDLSTHFHLAATDFLPVSTGAYLGYQQPAFALSSLSYQFKTAARTVTLVDQYVEESPLTVNNTTVRGLHWREGNWFMHAGYTSPAEFQNSFLPNQPEGAFGGGYRFFMPPNSSLTTSVYRLTAPGQDHTGTPGWVYSLLYTYAPTEALRVRAEFGASRGIGGSFDLAYRRAGENLRARVRYTPQNFAALSVGNFKGFYSDLSWSRRWTSQFSSEVFFAGNRFNLPSFQETSVNGGVQFQFRATRHWTLFDGVTYSRFAPQGSSAQAALEGQYYPLGLSFTSRHFGGTLQHQWSQYTGQNSGGHQWLVSAHTGWGRFGFNGYAERETQAPTLGFLLTQVQGLQEVLTQLGAAATTSQQIGAFLNQNAALINLNYLQHVTVNVAPVREQVSASATWQGRGREPHLDYEFLYNSDQSVNSSTQLAIQRVTATERLGASNDLLITWGQYRTKTPGEATVKNPLYALSLRHQFTTAPGFLVRERHGTIHGKVFEDADGQGNPTAAAPGMAGVEIIVDQRARTRTASDGSYRLSGIAEGKHQVQAVLHTRQPYFFTTPEQVETDADGEVNFSVAYSLSYAAGEAINDAGRGVSGVVVAIAGEGRRLAVPSGSDGRFSIPPLPEGRYDISIDEDSLPVGYATDSTTVEHIALKAEVPVHATFRLRAIRNVSGRVLIYDRSAGRDVPLAGVEVCLDELGLRKTTDAEGRYLFRELPSGTFTVSVAYRRGSGATASETTQRLVTVGQEPSQQNNIDVTVGPK